MSTYVMLSVGLLAVCLILLLLVLRRFKRRTRKTTVLSWVDIVRLFNDSQMMPIEHARDWTLAEMVHGVRVYRRTVSLNSNTVTLFACATKIKASSALVLSILREFHRQLDWNISVKRSSSVTGTGSSSNVDQSQASSPGGLVVNQDVIQQHRQYAVAVTDKPGWLSPSRWRRRPRSVASTQRRIIHRYWYREENNCCWLLEHDEEQRSVWTLNVMQPCTEGWFASKCVLSIISCGIDYSLTAERLACLRDLMALKRLQRTPIVRLTTVTAAGEQQQKQRSASAYDSDTTADSADKDMSWLQRFRRIIDERRESYEQRKVQQAASEGSAGNKAEIILGLQTADTPATTSRAAGSSVTFENSRTEVTSAADSRRGKLTIQTTSTDDSGSELRRRSPEEQTQDGSRERTGKSMMKSKLKQPSTSVTTITKQMEEMTTAAETTAFYLLVEKANVSHLNIRSSSTEQEKQSGGWTYCGLKKDVVILRRIQVSEKSSIHSYLGKGIVPCEPKLVFDIIRDPQRKTCYDEQATKVDVIHEFSSTMKIVYVQYEVSQLFKKECLDLCVLQSEKQDGVKYIVTMHSVQWPDCPTQDNITRVELSQSGWVIEPLTQNNSLYSMVTYISQAEIGRSKSNSGSGAVDELAAKQPLSIFNLRQHVTSAQTSEVIA